MPSTVLRDISTSTTSVICMPAWNPKLPPYEIDEYRVGPAAVGVAHGHHAAPAAPAETDRHFEDPRHDHDSIGAFEHPARDCLLGDARKALEDGACVLEALVGLGVRQRGGAPEHKGQGDGEQRGESLHFHSMGWVE